MLQMVHSSPLEKFVFTSWDVIILKSSAFKSLWSEQDFYKKNSAKMFNSTKSSVECSAIFIGV